MKEKNLLPFAGENIYVGIDVHLRSWSVSIFTECTFHKTFSQPPHPECLANYLKENFPGAIYYSAYEAGFSGYWTHYQLLALGINNIIINPADVPTTQKEQMQKSDTVDSRKIAKALRLGQLAPIHILSEQVLEDRCLIRTRSMLVQDMTRFKCRIKSFLYFHGIKYPPEFESVNKHWSKRFLKWLKEDIILPDSGKISLDFLIANVERLRSMQLDINRRIKGLCETVTYKEDIDLLLTIPGMGRLSAITFMTHIENINRFKNTDHLSSYIGLIPDSHSSGEKELTGRITFRGVGILKSILVENSWATIKADPVMGLAYSRYVKKMQPNKAIIRIARKLLNRVYYVLKNKREYVCGVVQ